MTEILNTKQAADFLGFSEITLKMSRTSGKMAGTKAPPYIKVGKSVRYKQSDLIDWLGQFEVRTETDKSSK